MKQYTLDIVENENKIKKRYLLVLMISIVFICFMLSGYNGQSSNYKAIVIFAMLICISTFSDLNAFLRIFHRKIFKVFIFYILCFSIFAIFSPNLYETSKVLGYTFIAFSAIFIFSYFIEIKQFSLLKVLFLCSFSVWIYYCVIAIEFYSKNSNAARRLASDSASFGDLAIGGGYNLAYGSTLLAIYLLDLYINKSIKNKKIRLLLILIIILLTILVIETLSTITIIGLFLGFSLVLIFKILGFVGLKKNNDKKIKLKQIILCLLLCMIFSIALINIKNFGLMLINETSNKSDIVSLRMNEVGIKLAYGDDFGGTMDFNTRSSILNGTISKFLESPIIGNGYKYGYTFYGSLNEGIGNHNEWIDTLAINGLVGGIPFLLIYVYGVKEERKYGNRYVSPSWIITLLFLGLFNPFVGLQSNFIVFFILPSISEILYRQEMKKKSELDLLKM